MDEFIIDWGQYKASEEIEAALKDLLERARKLEEILGGVSLILECREAVERAIALTIRTGSMYDARTYKILPAPPEGEMWAYRCARDRPVFIEVCKGDKHISVTFDGNRVKAVVGDATDSLFCIRRGEYHEVKRARRRGKR